VDFASFDDYWLPYLGKQGPGGNYVETLNPTSGLDGPRSYAASAWAVKGLTPE